MFNFFEETRILNIQLPIEWQSQNSLDELSVFLQHNWEQRSVFYDDGQITSKQQFLDFCGQQSIRTKQYVGTIVFKGQQLNIFPKVFKLNSEDTSNGELSLKHLMNNLVKWIEYCTKIDYPYINIKSELDDVSNLRDLFVTLYVRYVKNAIDRGIYYQYDNKEEDCSIVKGKINVKDYLLSKIPSGKNDRFLCSFSNFEIDNILNRIIKHTCKSLQADASSSNKKDIRHILAKLNEVSDCNCSPVDCDKVRLSRLHKHYSIILGMSKMFLLNKSSTYNVSNNDSFCFLFPTNVLFEGFIGGYIKNLLSGAAKVTLQASDLSLFSDVKFAGVSYGKSILMKHDILVEHKEKGLFILDTKYKNMDRFEDAEDVLNLINKEIHSSDVYQVLAYARSRNTKDVYLLYPMFRYEDIELNHVIGVSTNNMGIEPINVHLVRLPFVFEEDTEQTEDKLKRTLMTIFD